MFDRFVVLTPARCRAALLALLLAGLAAAMPASAQSFPWQPAERLDFPVNSPGVPAYARFEMLLPNFDLPNTRQWAAVVFYRDPACVPADFNLGDFFDLPGPGGPGAFGCPLLIEGHELWRNGQRAGDAAPVFVLSRNAVPDLPVWFVRWSELSDAMGDGELTITELEGLPSLLLGQASWFEERLYPNPVPGAPGGADAPGISIRAEGVLETGGRFELSWDYAGFGAVDRVRIRLRGALGAD